MLKNKFITMEKLWSEVETVPRETIDVTKSTKSATSATSKEFIKPTDVPILNWKTKSVKKLQDNRNQYIDYAIGKYYKSYSGNLDKIISIKFINDSPHYTVQDVKSGEIRTHRTQVKLSDLLIPKPDEGSLKLLK